MAADKAKSFMSNSFSMADKIKTGHYCTLIKSLNNLDKGPRRHQISDFTRCLSYTQLTKTQSYCFSLKNHLV